MNTHVMSLDYQIAQARRVKQLEAENNRLRAKIDLQRDILTKLRDTTLDSAQRNELIAQLLQVIQKP